MTLCRQYSIMTMQSCVLMHIDKLMYAEIFKLYIYMYKCNNNKQISNNVYVCCKHWLASAYGMALLTQQTA